MIYDSFYNGFENGTDVSGWQDFGANAYGDIASQAYSNDVYFPPNDTSFNGWGTEDFPNFTIDGTNNSLGWDDSTPSDTSYPDNSLTEYPIEYQVDSTPSDPNYGSPQMTDTGLERSVVPSDQQESAVQPNQMDLPQEFYNQVADKLVNDLFKNPDYSDKQLSDMLQGLYDNPALDPNKLDAAIDRSQRADDIARDVAGSDDPNQTWSDRAADLTAQGMDPLDYVSKVNQDLESTQNEDGTYSDRFVSMNSDGMATTNSQPNPRNEPDYVENNFPDARQDPAYGSLQTTDTGLSVIPSQDQPTDPHAYNKDDVYYKDPDQPPTWVDHSDDGIFAEMPNAGDPNYGADAGPQDNSDTYMQDSNQGWQNNADSGIAIDPYSALAGSTDTLIADANTGTGFPSDGFSGFDSWGEGVGDDANYDEVYG